MTLADMTVSLITEKKRKIYEYYVRMLKHYYYYNHCGKYDFTFLMYNKQSPMFIAMNHRIIIDFELKKISIRLEVLNSIL